MDLKTKIQGKLMQSSDQIYDDLMQEQTFKLRHLFKEAAADIMVQAAVALGVPELDCDGNVKRIHRGDAAVTSLGLRLHLKKHGITTVRTAGIAKKHSN